MLSRLSKRRSHFKSPSLRQLPQGNPRLSTKTKVLILVPGVFNSWIPGGLTLRKGVIPYFGKDIIRHLEKSWEVNVIDGLLPTGSFNANGEIVYQQIKKITAGREHDIDVLLLGHSSGGLYTLAALHKREDLSFISKVIFLATPLRGAILADLATAHSTPIITRALKAARIYPGLNQYRRAEVRRFVDSVRVPDHVRFYTSAVQPPSMPNDEFIHDWISNTLRHTAHIIRNKTGFESDGIVESNSSCPQDFYLTSLQERQLQVRPMARHSMNLNHWNMFLNASFFVGNKRTNIIRNRQRLYHNIVSAAGF